MSKSKSKSAQETLKIDVEQAVRSAVDYLNKVYSNQNISNIQLEEVELTDDESYWLITLSYQQPVDLLPIKSARKYKIFKINIETGEVKSMKIRNLD